MVRALRPEGITRVCVECREKPIQVKRTGQCSRCYYRSFRRDPERTPGASRVIRSAQEIENLLERLEELLRRGVGRMDAYRKLGVSPTNISSWLRSRPDRRARLDEIDHSGLFWHRARTDEMAALLEGGATRRRLAEHFGVSEASVAMAINRDAHLRQAALTGSRVKDRTRALNLILERLDRFPELIPVLRTRLLPDVLAVERPREVVGQPPHQNSEFPHHDAEYTAASNG